MFSLSNTFIASFTKLFLNVTVTATASIFTKYNMNDQLVSHKIVITTSQYLLQSLNEIFSIFFRGEVAVSLVKKIDLNKFST